MRAHMSRAKVPLKCTCSGPKSREGKMTEELATARKPLLLHYTEPGPPAIEVTGEYDASSQTWRTDMGHPHVPTRSDWLQPTAVPTNSSTNGGRDYVPDTHEDSERVSHED
jgi:hypothetical protein